MIACYIKMEDSWMNETIIGGEIMWEEAEDGTLTQIVDLHLKNGSTIHQIIQEGVSKKEYFTLQLKGNALWPPTQWPTTSQR